MEDGGLCSIGLCCFLIEQTDNICWDAAFKKKKNRSILCQNTVMLLNLLKARTHVVHPQGHVSVKELPNVSIVLTLLLRFYENPRVD